MHRINASTILFLSLIKFNLNNFVVQKQLEQILRTLNMEIKMVKVLHR